MAMMAKMRSLAPAFIIAVGVLFVLFMVMSDSKIMEVFGGRSNNIAVINGKEITYNEFQAALEQEKENKKQQTGEDVPEDQYEQFREQVWDGLITRTLIAQEVNRLGIAVSDQEVKDVILSDDPPSFLKQNFIDSTGKFNKELYLNAIYDPQNEKVLLQAEDYVRQMRLNEKLQSMLLASVTVSEQEVKRKFTDQNIYMNAQYVNIENTLFPDSTFSVSDEELKNYYDENIDKYKVDAQRKLRFIAFPLIPSSADTQTTITTLQNVKEMTGTDTASFKSYVGIYSDVPYTIDTLAFNSITEQGMKAIRYAKKDEIVGPVNSPQGYALYHLLEIIPAKDKLLRASHILINGKPTPEENLAEANRVYQEILNGADFKEVAKQNSGDPGSAVRGGDLGWFRKGMMVKEFENACFNSPIGVVQKPIKTNFGYHIIIVTDESDSKYVVEKIVSPVKISAATSDEIYNSANDFAYLAKKNGFDKEADLAKYKIQESSPFTKKVKIIPGIGSSQRLQDFAFDNSLNDVSDVYRITNKYFVTQISEIIPEGFRDFLEIQSQIKQEVLTEKKFNKGKTLAEELLKKSNGDITKIPQIDNRFQLKVTNRFNALSSIPGLGKEYFFINKCSEMKPGESTNDPVKGLRGNFLIKLLDKTPFDSTAFKTQSTTLRSSLLQEKKTSYVNTWLAELKDNADIVDNRHVFFGY
jgi:peptidyl-prolyl cis-trans isomerase D